MHLKASVTVFVLILLGLIIGLFLFGYSSIATSFLYSEDLTTVSAETIMDSIWGALTSEGGVVILGLTLTFAVLTVFGSGGYIAGNIVPFAILTILVFLFANIFFFPVISEPEIANAIPDIISVLLSAVLNVLLLLAVIGFIGGRD